MPNDNWQYLCIVVCMERQKCQSGSSQELPICGKCIQYNQNRSHVECKGTTCDTCKVYRISNHRTSMHLSCLSAVSCYQNPLCLWGCMSQKKELIPEVEDNPLRDFQHHYLEVRIRIRTPAHSPVISHLPRTWLGLGDTRGPGIQDLRNLLCFLFLRLRPSLFSKIPQVLPYISLIILSSPRKKHFEVWTQNQTQER
jgi:hypothetical protein